MKSIMTHGLCVALALAGGMLGAIAHSAEPSLAGTWTLTAADRLYPDGARTRDYGDHPKGRLIIDAEG